MVGQNIGNKTKSQTLLQIYIFIGCISRVILSQTGENSEILLIWVEWVGDLLLRSGKLLFFNVNPYSTFFNIAGGLPY